MAGTKEPRKRRQYTTSEREEILAEANELGVVEASRRRGIPQTTVSNWRNRDSGMSSRVEGAQRSERRSLQQQPPRTRRRPRSAHTRFHARRLAERDRGRSSFARILGKQLALPFPSTREIVQGTGGTDELPELTATRWRKTFGSSALILMEGSIVAQPLEEHPEITLLEYQYHLDAVARDDHGTIEAFLRVIYGRLRQRAHGEPLEPGDCEGCAEPPAHYL